MKPDFFQYDRLNLANERDSEFNDNTHKANGFKRTLRRIRIELCIKKRNEVFGDDVITPLPFKCEEKMVKWGVQGYPNDDKEIRRKNHI